MPQVSQSTPLPSDLAVRLREFARSCRAAARAVALYPAEHPAITLSLGRLAQESALVTGGRSLTLSVLPDNLQIDGKSADRADGGIVELALALHERLIGSLTIHQGIDEGSWRAFFGLLAKSPEDLRAEGGIARLWKDTGHRGLEIVEIDYFTVLREHGAGPDAGGWDAIIQNLSDASRAVDAAFADRLLSIAENVDDLKQLLSKAWETSGGGSDEAGRSALTLVVGRLMAVVAERNPERLAAVSQTLGLALGQLSPQVMIDLATESRGRGGPADVVGALGANLTNTQMSDFVASALVANQGASNRLAAAFHALIPDRDRQRKILALTHDELSSTSTGQANSFEEFWHTAEELLTSYSDEPFVSASYAQELTTAGVSAIEVERLHQDPPERIAEWLGSVGDTVLRDLDTTLLQDLLRLEGDHKRWAMLIDSLAAKVEELVGFGELAAAEQVGRVLAGPMSSTQADRRASTQKAIARLAEGACMKDVVALLGALDDHSVERVSELCRVLGPTVIRPLAEALAVEEATRTRRRLRDLLVSFGAEGRVAVERLMTSASADVRRTAAFLLREFGGHEALPALETLLNDAEPNVQREAIRAILRVGNDQAFAALERALISSAGAARAAIMQALGTLRDERAGPLFCYIVRHGADYQGSLRGIYTSAVEALGTIGGPDAVEALEEALYRGRWWTPRRTATERVGSAQALKRIGTRAALDVLRRAAQGGSRGLRKVARSVLGEES